MTKVKIFPLRPPKTEKKLMTLWTTRLSTLTPTLHIFKDRQTDTKTETKTESQTDTQTHRQKPWKPEGYPRNTFEYRNN